MKVLLTCATSGIGTSLVESLPEINWIPASRSGKTHLPLDFSSPASFAHVAQGAGKLDGVVLIPPRVNPPTDLFPSIDEWSEYFTHAFASPMAFLREIIEAQTPNRPLKIVVISGLSSVCALPSYGSANALRLAWLGQTKSIALTLSSKGIRINTLSLGAVLTEAYRGKLQLKAEKAERTFEEQLAFETDNVPTGRYSTGKDVSHAVKALLGPMSDQMTGQNFVMDGGFFRGY